MKRRVVDAESSVRKIPKCTIYLPDDVLTIIGSFLSWDESYASSYRMVCKGIKFGIDLTARAIAMHSPNRLYMRFGRTSAHFGPPNTLPICVRNITVPTHIEGSWRNLLGQVFGCCDTCNSSSRWMLGCKELGCNETSCLSCIESEGSGRAVKCCDAWYCTKHSSMKKCKGCYRQCCRSCIQAAESRRRSVPGSMDLCISCTNWDSDSD